MMIYINGQETALKTDRVLLHYLPEFDPGLPFAVALNGDFVPRTDYAKVVLQEGDQIDVVSPVGGG